MKFSTITFSLTLLSSASAFCTFRLKVANSVNTDLNGLYVQSLNGVATLGPPFTDITAEFPDPQIITDSTLISTGAPGDGNGKFTLESSLGVERIVFADIPPPGARYTDWTLVHSLINSRLTYGTSDRFVVFSPGAPVAHYEIYLVPKGAAFGGSEVDLVVECV